VASSQAAIEAERDDRDDFESAAEAAAEVFGEREPESLAHDEELAKEPAVTAGALAAESDAKPKRRKAAPTAKAPAKRVAPKPAAKKTVAKAAITKPAAKGKAKVAPKSTAKSSAKTGSRVKPVSVDKHLVDDEPVLPQPARRPRSVRDLDAIPDDYDE
jgi:hypothetical protein